MKRSFPLLIALILIGCANPPATDPGSTKVPTPPQELKISGRWRNGTAKENYRLVQIFKDDSIAFSGTRLDMLTSYRANGDMLTLEIARATMSNPSLANDPALRPPNVTVQAKSIGPDSLEMTELSGVLFGSADPVQFQRVSSDEYDTASSAIMQRIATMGG